MSFHKNTSHAVNALLNARLIASKRRNSFAGKVFRFASGKLNRWKDDHNQAKITNAINLLKANHIVRPILEFRGTFELDVRSNLTHMVLNEDFGREIIPFLEAILKPGQQFIDIGANIGLYAILASQLVGDRGRVLAIEPVPSVFSLLSSNITRNNLRNITLFNGVVTAQSGTCHLNIVEGSPEYSSMGSIVHPHAPNKIQELTVLGETLDNLVSENGLDPVLVKIDVEGAEGLVLSGADFVLRNKRPAILSELDDRLLKTLNWNSRQVIRLLEDYQYTVFDANNCNKLSSDKSVQPFIGEIVAVYEERCASHA